MSKNRQKKTKGKLGTGQKPTEKKKLKDWTPRK